MKPRLTNCVSPLIKEAIIILFAVFFWIPGNSQNSKVEYYTELRKKVIDSTGQLRLNHVLRQEFSKIINSNSNGNLGNFVGLSTDDNNLSFAYSFLTKSSAFQLSAGGGVSDGVTNIITNSKLNTGINVGFTYYRMFGKKNISINYDKIHSLQKKDRELTEAYEKYKLNDSNNQKKLAKDAEVKKSNIEQLEARIKKLKDIRAELLNGSSKTFLDSGISVELEYKKRLLKVEIKQLVADSTTATITAKQNIKQLQIRRDASSTITQTIYEADSIKALHPIFLYHDSIQTKKTSLKVVYQKIKENTFSDSKIADAEAKLKMAKLEYEIAIEKLENNLNGWDLGAIHNTYIENQRKNLGQFKEIRAKEIDLTWFGVGGQLENKSFNLLDTLNNVYNNSDLIPSLSLSVTRYINKIISGSSHRRIWYTTFAAKVRYGNNLNTLKEITVETTDSLSDNSVSVSSTKAFIGDYKAEIFSGELTCDHYRFVGNKNNIGMHFRGQLDILKKDTFFSLRAGVIFAVLSQKDYQSVVNFELFFGLNDIFKAGEEKNLFSRNVVGLQATLPFKFNIK